MSDKAGKIKVIDIRNVKNMSGGDEEEDGEISKFEIEKHDEDPSEDPSEEPSEEEPSEEEPGEEEPGEEEPGEEEPGEEELGGRGGGDISSESEYSDEESNSESESFQSGGSGSSSASTTSTIELLSEDPLFLVLSHYLVNNKNENIVTVLSKINSNLSRLVKILKKKK